ncbi:MAG: Cu(I)/Ag(I) efflux system outer membrane protein CusC [Gammaproteobacteria bacterium]|nr:Cu(I)/Ag(I) efflux system outer membrane protein CusC [Gammaproteobacteria bacterium]
MNITITLRRQFLLQFVLFIFWPFAAFADANTAGYLTLSEAEQLALASDPVIAQFQAQAEAFSARAVAEGQLPDPELSIGLAEVPLNNFDFGDHEDTELRLGLSQAFPPGQTLRLRGERMGSMADAEQARVMNQRMLVLSEVRNAYVELYYQQEAARKLELNRDLFSEMVELTEHQYAQGRDNQHDIMRAQLELSLIESRIEETRGAIAVARAELAKWVTATHAARPLAAEFPAIPEPPESETLIAQLPGHPLLSVEDAVIAATQKSVAIAHEQYKPQWMLDFMVSDNTASDFDLQTGPDFAGVMLKMSLPIFTGKRQDRQLAASEQEAMAARYGRADRLRELTRLAEGEYANLARLERQLELYRSRAVVEAGQTQEAVFNAYQNDLADFETLVRTRVLALETELEMLRLRSGCAKSRVNLLYLGGEQS